MEIVFKTVEVDLLLYQELVHHALITVQSVLTQQIVKLVTKTISYTTTNVFLNVHLEPLMKMENV
jgi:hypothetical protein